MIRALLAAQARAEERVGVARRAKHRLVRGLVAEELLLDRGAGPDCRELWLARFAIAQARRDLDRLGLGHQARYLIAAQFGR